LYFTHRPPERPAALDNEYSKIYAELGIAASTGPQPPKSEDRPNPISDHVAWALARAREQDKMRLKDPKAWAEMVNQNTEEANKDPKAWEEKVKGLYRGR
jgi:hypothetical protein